MYRDKLAIQFILNNLFRLKSLNIYLSEGYIKIF